MESWQCRVSRQQHSRPVMWLKMGLERKGNPIIPASPIRWPLYKHDHPNSSRKPPWTGEKARSSKGNRVLCKVGAKLRAVWLQCLYSLHPMLWIKIQNQSQGEQQIFNKHSFVSRRQLLPKILLPTLPLQILYRNCYRNNNNRIVGKFVKQQDTS